MTSKLTSRQVGLRMPGNFHYSKYMYVNDGLNLHVISCQIYMTVNVSIVINFKKYLEDAAIHSVSMHIFADVASSSILQGF